MMLGQYVLAIRSSLDSGEAPRKIIAALERDHGAQLKLIAGTYHLCLATITGTSRASGDVLLEAWMKAAQYQVERERAR